MGPKMLKLLKLPMLKDRNSITEDTAVDTEDVVTVAPSLMRLLKLKTLLLKLPMLKDRSNITEDTAVDTEDTAVDTEDTVVDTEDTVEDTEDTEVDFMVSFPGTSKMINLNLKNGFCYLSTLCY